MGTGTDVAMQSGWNYAGQRRPDGHRTGAQVNGAVMSNIRQNLFFAFIYNLLGVPIAVGILYPWMGSDVLTQ